MTNEADQKPKKSGMGSLILSVFAAAFGVQSRKNQERDFAEGKTGAFIVAGLLFVVFFVASVATVVSLVLPD